MIIATAGHVDHGKTSLVRALTGIDTDRLPEEKARGLTIDLGFAYMPLPDGRLIGFVDVPGHQRFIANMLAGVGNIDHAVLVVAADDGVMPQTAEHVAILDLAGVTCATVVITKTDRATRDRCAAVEAESGALLRGTGIAPDAVITLSVRTGDGMAALRTHLMELAGAHRGVSPTGRFRLAVDRCFALRGIGTVVTGSVHAGTADVGDAVTVAPAGRPARIRGLRIHDRDVAAVRSGERCAINLAGVATEEVGRGDWIIAGGNQTTTRLDVGLRLLAAEPALRHWTPAHLHIGAADVTCRIALLDERSVEPGVTAFASLRLDRPVAAWAGQRFILRDQSAQRTIGGGRVLDPLPPDRDKRASRLRRLAAMNETGPASAFARLAAACERGFDVNWFSTAWNLTVPEEQDLLSARPIEVVADPDRRTAMHPDHWRALLQTITDVLSSHHQAHPNLLGLDDHALRAAVRPPVSRAMLRRAIAALFHTGELRRTGAIHHLTAHRVQPTSGELAMWRRIEPALAGGGTRPPRVRELVDVVDVDLGRLEAFLGRAEQLGWVHKVAPNRVYLPQPLDDLERIAARLAVAAPDGTFTAADFNLATGIGRNLTIQVLEYFDRLGITRRDGDRRRLPHAATPAPPR